MIKFPLEIIETIKNSSSVAIFTHVKPDGDCLGSAMALKLTLEKLGKKCDVFCPTQISEDFKIIKNIASFNCPKLKSYDLAISVDIPDRGRMGYDISRFDSISKSIKIDHHLGGSENFATYNFSLPTASTANLIYYLILQLKVEIDDDIASCLYTGIATDTGCFKHKNTTKEEHYIVSKLMEFNFDYNDINYHMFVHKTMDQVNLIKILYENIKLYFGDKVLISNISLKDYERTNLSTDNDKELIQNLNGIGNSLIYVLIRQNTPNKFIVGFRSCSEKYDVASFAQKYFGGGGHPMAAGCTIYGSYKLVISKILSALKDEYGWIC